MKNWASSCILWILTLMYFGGQPVQAAEFSPTTFTVQIVDTMKTSRDLAREKKSSTTYSTEIDRQVNAIAELGATHVAIATPFDEEFFPFLQRWVTAARAHNLQVWFRGNWSGWEGWFGYPRITRDEHLEKTEVFLREHADLFVDGDIFTACPECENGGPGDPRQTGDVEGYRQFILAQHELADRVFSELNRSVATNYQSMNADVARVVMDRSTTTALGGLVTIDHYVATPGQLDQDITSIADVSGGRVMLGEWGVPIPDIHGNLSDEEQASWVDEALSFVVKNPHLVGMNYWVDRGGSTALWTSKGNPRPVVAVLRDWYRPRGVFGVVRDQRHRPISGVRVRSVLGQDQTSSDGRYRLALSSRADQTIRITASGFTEKKVTLTSSDTEVDFILTTVHASWWERVQAFFGRFRLWPFRSSTVTR